MKKLKYLDSTTLPNQKPSTSSTQRRMLTKSEIESLQKDKRDSFEKINKIFDEMGVF